ncbi:MAG: hypothetical protein J5725_13180 [Bacteroidales bacterium]|nr:hypothetical protein [Bacteroidales bacterium]
MITWANLEKVNKEIVTTEVKGKPYATVTERIKAFRKLFPDGTILTEIISNENGVCVIKATVGFYDQDGMFKILGTGTAYEKENSSFINNTSYIENCETSACGRALGMCGFGIDNDVASAEETQNAQLQQDALKPITAEKKKALIKSCQEDGIPESYICELYGVSEIKELTEAKFVNLMTNWEKMKAKYNERKNS